MSLRQQSEQLSLQVFPHPKLPPDAPIIGTLKVKGDLRIGRDLNAGDRLVVIVQDADGNVLTTSDLEVASPAFKELKDDGRIIATERVHTAEVTHAAY